MSKTGEENRQDFRGALLLWGVLGLFILTVCFVNPFREMPLEDDWAYALSVQHLLDTGKYQLHDWASANMVLQVYWGALFEHILGIGYGNLRVSTLVLAFVGLVAFYALALEHRLTRWMAAFATMILLSGPVFLFFSFSFHTDVPFLALLIVGLLLYTRAIRLRSYGWMIAASLAASAAILTRQFGVALVAGIIVLWMVEGCDRRKIPFYLTGVVLPVIAAVWQYHQASANPNWGMKYALATQAHYLSTFRLLAGGLVWKPAVVFQYMALYSLPFVLWSAVALVRDVRQGSQEVNSIPRAWDIGLSAAFLIYLILVMIKMGRIMPIIPYNFLEVERIGLILQIPITVITTIGCVLCFRILLRRYFDIRSWAALPPQERFLDITTLLLLIFHLFFHSFFDKYLLFLVPFILIVVGRYLQERDLRIHGWAVLATIIILVLSAMWTRANLERQEAHWKAGEQLKAAGIPVAEIYGSWQWIAHYRFHEYIREIGGRVAPNLGDLFDRWMPEQYKAACYAVVADIYRRDEAMASMDRKPSDEEWQVIGEVRYRTMFFCTGKATMVKKNCRAGSAAIIPSRGPQNNP
jgi:4-amino-4-deoxy-L-arabinose transferase-like glycosyltransferase